MERLPSSSPSSSVRCADEEDDDASVPASFRRRRGGRRRRIWSAMISASLARRATAPSAAFGFEFGTRRGLRRPVCPWQRSWDLDSQVSLPYRDGIFRLLSSKSSDVEEARGSDDDPRRRSRLAEFESEFFDLVDPPSAETGASPRHAAEAKAGGYAAALAGGYFLRARGAGTWEAAPLAKAEEAAAAAAPSSSSHPSAGGRPAPSMPSSSFAPPPPPWSQPHKKQKKPPRPWILAQPPTTARPVAGGRPLPPPVSEYDYDYYDEELGVSARFGEEGDAGERGGRGVVTKGRSQKPVSVSIAKAAGGGTFLGGIEGADDPDCDPYFSVDADGMTARLPETEEEARWAEEGVALAAEGGLSYGLLDDGDLVGQSFEGRPGMKKKQSLPTAAERSSFRSAEEFLSWHGQAPAKSKGWSAPRMSGAPNETTAASSAVRGRPVAPSGPASLSSVSPASSSSGPYEAEGISAAVRSEIRPKYDEVRDIFTPSPKNLPGEQPRHDNIETIFEPAAKKEPQWEEPRFDEADEIFAPLNAVPSAMTSETASIPSETADFLSASSSGTGAASAVSALAARLKRIKADAVAANGGVEFNPNSPKQVAEVLYGKDGSDGQSTDRSSLEALASTGNEVADLVLKHRKCLSNLRREVRRAENGANGSHVASMWDVHSSRRRTRTKGTERFSPPKQPARKKYGFNADSLESDPLLLVDASAYIFRAYYSMPPLHRSDGTPVGAVLGFCNMLNRLVLNRMLLGLRPRLALVFDSPGPTFRHELYPEYKANRGPCPVDLVPQFDLIRKAADAYGIAQVEEDGYEADDLIATLACKAVVEGVDVNVLSGDKDLMQLVTPKDTSPGIHMIDPMNMEHITYEAVLDKWGVPPEKLGDVLALAGDSSDNIPGVPGIGPKTAAPLINDFGSLEELLQGAESIKQKGRKEKIMENADKARLSRSLVGLDRDVPLAKTGILSKFDSVSDIRMDPISAKKMLDFFDAMGFVDLKRRVSAQLRSSAGRGEASRSAASLPLMEGADAIERMRNSSVLDAVSGSEREDGLQGGPKAGGEGDRIYDKSSNNGLLAYGRKWASPPKPEDFADVPF